MFLSCDTDLFELTQKSETSKIPNSIYHVYYTGPTLSQVGQSSGAYVVANYLNNFIYQYKGDNVITDANVTSIYNKALDLDKSLDLDDEIEIPTLKNTMQACIDLEYVKTAKVGYITSKDNNFLILKDYIRNYKSVVLEVMMYPCVYNADSYEINDIGGLQISEDINKGFVACGYDSTGIIVQNTRGIKCGSLGFHRISWNVLDQIFVKAASFTDI